MTVTIENLYTGNGSTTNYSFTFPYLDEPDIKASLDGVVTTNFRLLNATTVQFVNNTTANTPTAPGNGVAIRIYRETAYENPKATFYPGAAIRAGDLNDNTLQNLYVNQESNDKVADAWLRGDQTVISSESWHTSDDTKVASTKAIENRINSQIDTALTGDVVAGSSITIADNTPSAGKITVSVDAASGSATGSMSSSDFTKLQGIESNATADQTNAEIRTAVENATDSNVFTDADHSKLNGIEASATADQTDSEIKTAYENNSNTNAYTDAEKTKLSGIEASATADQTDAEIRTAVENATDSNVFTDADHTKLNGIEASATADQTAAEIKTAYESNAQTNPLTDAEKAVIDGVTANTSELNKLDGVTATTANLNIVSGKTFRASGDGTLTTTSDTEIPSSKVIASHVASAVSNVGGFVTIANEISFPTTANQPANGVIVSISDAAGTVVNGSGVSTTGRTTDGTPATVTINNFPSSLNSETLASGVALLVTSTGSSNTYNYHKILAAETDVKSLSDDINDFNARYRVASSAPGSNNDDGDLWFDTAANKMKVYNATGSSWDDVASVGQFFINTISSSSGTGGGSATFNGSAYRFTLSNPATGGASQLLVSVNGVVQKPNGGSSQPSEGFAIDGNDIIFSTAPASGSDYFIITQGSSVSIGTPSANSVNSSHIIDGSIVNADISNSAAIAKTKLASLDVVNADVNASANIAGSKLADDSIPEVKLDVHNAPATDKYLKYTSNGMEWSDGASEGTDVKSTGESGTTKFLRVDGDGTCSWQVPPDTNTQLTLKDEDNFASNSDTAAASQQSIKAYVDTQVGSISAAPEVTAVASGSIGANASVQLNSNGTVSVVSRATPAIGTKREFNSASIGGHIAACYNPTDKVVVVIYRRTSGWIRYGTVSGDEITFSAETEWSGDTVEYLSIAHDLKNNVYFIGYRNDDNGYGYIFTLTANGTTYGTKSSSYQWTSSNARGNTLAWASWAEKMIFARVSGSSGNIQTLTYNGTSAPTANSVTNFDSSVAGFPSVCVDVTNSKAYLSYNNSSSTDGFTRIITLSGTSTSQTNAASWHSHNAYYVRTVYDTTNSKLVVTFTDGNDGEKSKVITGTINHSNNQISWSNAVEIDGSGYSSYSAVVFNSDRGKIDYYSKDHDSYLYYVEIDASGTHPTCTTKVIVDNSNTTNNWSAATFDSDTFQSFNFYEGQSGSGDYISKDSGASTLTAENFLGFSSAAYTNGQTATINVVGNTTTQSSLTPAQKYYIQLDGTLGLSPVNPSVEAGLALSSTKLLIKG